MYGDLSTEDTMQVAKVDADSPVVCHRKKIWSEYRDVRSLFPSLQKSGFNRGMGGEVDRLVCGSPRRRNVFT